MKTLKFYRYAAALVVASALVWACGDSNSGGPASPTPSPVASNPAPTPAQPAPPAPTPPPTDHTEGSAAKGRYSARVISAAGTWGVTIEHLAGWTDEKVGVACYENPDRTTGANQTFVDGRTVLINSGGSVTLGATIPQCVAWQCDAFEGSIIRGEGADVFYGRSLIMGRSGGPQGDCAPPPPPPKCNPEVEKCGPPVCDVDKLSSEAKNECEGPFTLDVEACTFKCDPPPPPQCDPDELRKRARAACEFGIGSLDLQACTFECNPPPPKCDVEELRGRASAAAGAACEFGVESITLDTDACTFDFTCNPPPPPQCDVEALRGKANAAAAAACEFGVDEIFLDTDACTFDFSCTPPPECPTIAPDDEGNIVWCHTSSKVNGVINEKQESNPHQLPPGHCLHFDLDKWNPPDYPGVCDGRSFPDN